MREKKKEIKLIRGEKNNKKLIFSYTILDCTVPKLECHYLLMPNVLAFRTPNVREILVFGVPFCTADENPLNGLGEEEERKAYELARERRSK